MTPKIRTTASQSLTKKVSWGGIQHEHDEDKNHKKNPFLNTTRSKYLRQLNRTVKLQDYDNLQEEFWSAFVQKHDAKETHKDRKYGSVKRYLRVDSRGKQRKNQPYYMNVLKFSEKEVYWDFIYTEKAKLAKLRGISEDKAELLLIKGFGDGIENYARNFNVRHKNLQITDYRLDLDEEGAPHAHSRLLARSYTQKGKPSNDLNRALRSEYTGLEKLSNRDRVAKFREIEDKKLFDSVTTSLVQEFPDLKLQNRFEFIRKTDEEKVATGLAHDEYRRRKKVLSDLHTQAQGQRGEIRKNVGMLAQQENDKKSNLTILTNQQNSIKSNNAKIQTQTAKIAKNEQKKAQQEFDIKSNSTKLTNLEKRLDKKTKERDAELKEKTNEVKKAFAVASLRASAVVTEQRRQEKRKKELEEKEEKLKKKENQLDETATYLEERDNTFISLTNDIGRNYYIGAGSTSAEADKKLLKKPFYKSVGQVLSTDPIRFIKSIALYLQMHKKTDFKNIDQFDYLYEREHYHNGKVLRATIPRGKAVAQATAHRQKNKSQEKIDGPDL